MSDAGAILSVRVAADHIRVRIPGPGLVRALTQVRRAFRDSARWLVTDLLLKGANDDEIEQLLAERRGIYVEELPRFVDSVTRQ